MVQPQSSELRELVERFVADRDNLDAFYSVKGSALRIRRLREFYAAWTSRLEAMPYERLGTEGRIDWLLLRHQLDYARRLLDREEERRKEMAPLISFSEDLARLEESRRLMEPVDPPAAAATLERVTKRIAEIQDGLEAGLKGEAAKPPQPVAALSATPVTAYRAAAAVGEMRDVARGLVPVLPRL